MALSSIMTELKDMSGVDQTKLIFCRSLAHGEISVDRPLSFYVAENLSDSDRLKHLVLSRGGRLSRQPGKCDSSIINIVHYDRDPSNNPNAPPGVSGAFIEDCVEQGKLLDFHDYIVTTTSPTSKFPSRARLKSPAKKRVFTNSNNNKKNKKNKSNDNHNHYSDSESESPNNSPIYKPWRTSARRTLSSTRNYSSTRRNPPLLSPENQQKIKENENVKPTRNISPIRTRSLAARERDNKAEDEGATEHQKQTLTQEEEENIRAEVDPDNANNGNDERDERNERDERDEHDGGNAGDEGHQPTDANVDEGADGDHQQNGDAAPENNQEMDEIKEEQDLQPNTSSPQRRKRRSRVQIINLVSQDVSNDNDNEEPSGLPPTEDRQPTSADVDVSTDRDYHQNEGPRRSPRNPAQKQSGHVDHDANNAHNNDDEGDKDRQLTNPNVDEGANGEQQRNDTPRKSSRIGAHYRKPALFQRRNEARMARAPSHKRREEKGEKEDRHVDNETFDAVVLEDRQVTKSRKHWIDNRKDNLGITKRARYNENVETRRNKTREIDEETDEDKRVINDVQSDEDNPKHRARNVHQDGQPRRFNRNKAPGGRRQRRNDSKMDSKRNQRHVEEPSDINDEVINERDDRGAPVKRGKEGYSHSRHRRDHETERETSGRNTSRNVSRKHAEEFNSHNEHERERHLTELPAPGSRTKSEERVIRWVRKLAKKCEVSKVEAFRALRASNGRWDEAVERLESYTYARLSL